MKAKQLPRQVEWDYRGIRAEELPLAVEYEYLRANDAARKKIVLWLDCGVGTKTVRKHLLEDGGERRKVLESFPMSPYCFEILVLVPMFPAPWMAFFESDRVETVKAMALPSVSIIPLRKTQESEVCMRRNADLKIHHFAGVAGKAPRNLNALLHVNFSRPIGIILRDFERVIRKEARSFTRAAQGKAAQPEFSVLKDLAV